MWLYLVNIYTDFGTFETIVLAMTVAIGVLAFIVLFAPDQYLPPRKKKWGSKKPKM